MRFALFNQLQMPKPWRGKAEARMHKQAIEEAVFAEAVGFDSYWQTEHHFYTEIGHSSAPEIVLAAISQRTTRLRLGLGVVVLPCNHPFRVAEYVSTLDVVSDGRVEFGTGRGASPYHVEAFGYSHSASKEVWDAARLGLGAIGLVRLGAKQLAPAIAAYRAAVNECDPVGGSVNHQIGAYAICGIDKDYSIGRDIAGAAARWYFGDNQAALQSHRFDSQALLSLSNEQLIAEGIIIGGDPDSVCRGLERWRKLGVDLILLMLGAGNTTHTQVMRGLELLGEKVLPQFR